MSKKEATPADAPKEDSGPYFISKFLICNSEVGTMKNGDYCVHVSLKKTNRQNKRG